MITSYNDILALCTVGEEMLLFTLTLASVVNEVFARTDFNRNL